MDYDINGCMLLLGAVVRLWWRDALRNQADIDELAAFLEVEPASLASGPPRYYHQRNNYADLRAADDPTPPPWRTIRRGPAYTRRGIGE